jgi:pimeloyl-ACP methyl ester carboxylesterase
LGDALSGQIPPRLEVLFARPRKRSAYPPLLFVHGAFAGAWCWAEHFLDFFAAQGFAAHALSLRGHGLSAGREHLDWHSIDDYVSDVAEVAAGFDTPPVLIGHSMGGLVVQKYLEQATVPAAVLMASVPPQGLLSASMQFAMQSPDLFRDINAVFHGGQASAEGLRQILFAQPVNGDVLQHYYRLMQPESQRAIWDMALFNLPQRWRMQVPPLLILGAELDALIPARFAEATANYYGVQAEIIPGIGHGMMLEAGWEYVALRIADWISTTLKQLAAEASNPAAGR